MKPNLEYKVKIHTEGATEQIEKATQAVKKLQIELDKLKKIVIGIEVVLIKNKVIKKKWWQFWK